ncbi:transposase, partial [Nitratifractor sp.]|uniref:transposase n=1 Tax=Nitratifractor sp. TaxID=2268144 RepID=UPI0025FB6BE6
MGYRCRELLREIAMSKEMIIYAGSINRDHVHMLIGIPPNVSVSKAVQYLKGKSSHKPILCNRKSNTPCCLLQRSPNQSRNSHRFFRFKAIRR